MTKNISLFLAALSAFSGVSQAQSVDAYYATLNLGMGFKNKVPTSGSSLANVRVIIDDIYAQAIDADAGKKADVKNKIGFAGDLRFGRDFQLGQSCGFLGLFVGIGLGGGSSNAKVDTTIKAGDVPVSVQSKMTQGMYIPLGMRLGYSISGTKIFLTLGYAPQKVNFSAKANGEKISASKMVGSFLVGLGFSTPVSQNASLGLSVESYFAKIKTPSKIDTFVQPFLSADAQTVFAANAKKASSYVQTRVLVSFTYNIPAR